MARVNFFEMLKEKKPFIEITDFGVNIGVSKQFLIDIMVKGCLVVKKEDSTILMPITVINEIGGEYWIYGGDNQYYQFVGTTSNNKLIVYEI